MTDSVSVLIVTGAGGPLGVNVTRSLRMGSENLRLIGTDANRWHLPLSLCDETYLIPPAKDRDQYRQALRDIVERERVAAILPTHPVEVRALASLRDDGDLSSIGLCLPSSSTLEIADNKTETQRRLRDANVAVPDTVDLVTDQDLVRAFRELRSDDEPVWVRGAGAPGLGIGGAALPCRDVNVARAWIEHHRGWGRMSASRYLPGANLTWMGLFERGNLLAAGTRERLEYVLPHVSPSGITGAPAVSRTIGRPDVEELGERAVRAIDGQPHGAFFVDFKCDGNNEPFVTEINAGRCGTTVHFYTQAGYNFPWSLARLALGQSVAAAPEPNRAIPTGLYWVRTLDCGPVLLTDDSEFDNFPRAGQASGNSL